MSYQSYDEIKEEHVYTLSLLNQNEKLMNGIKGVACMVG